MNSIVRHIRRRSATGLLLVALLPANACTGASADPAPNLLLAPPASADATSGEWNSPGWHFDLNNSQGVQAQVATDTAVGPYLSIKAPAGASAQCWWRQELAAGAHLRYTLSLLGRGFSTDDRADRVIDAGVFFRGSDGKWLGYQTLATMAEKQLKWPASTKPDTPNWKAYSASFETPPGTTSLGIRLNLSGGAAKAGFAQLRLIMAASVSDLLNALPASLPLFNAALRPVSTNAITQTPDWKLEDAASWNSSTRHKTCLNGLWAVQPAAIDGAVGEAGPAGWAFMKVPGRPRSANPTERSFFYGQDQTIWANRNVVSPAFWLWREVTLPAQEGRFSIEIAQLTGSVARVYWNGQPIGIVNDYWGARIDLPAEARPGDKGQLAIFLLCNSTFNSSKSELIAAGKAARDYQFEANKRPWYSEIGDVYLQCRPNKPTFDGVRISTSVRRHELSVTLDGRTAAPSATWRLRVRTCGPNGIKVIDLPAAAAESGDRVRLTVPWSNPHLWTPDDPYLYCLQVALVDSNGHILDESLPERFGFREIWVNGKFLKLNGQTLRLRPRMSYPIFASGTESARRAFKFLKSVGFNCIIRPPAMQDEESETAFYDEYYDLADEMGMMMVCYTPYGLVTGGQFGASQTVTGDDLVKYIDSRLVARTCNHPSVIAYGGFGPGMTVSGNPYNANPEWFGVAPLDTPAKFDALAKQYRLDDNLIKPSKTSALDFVRAVKALTPDRPFLSHYDSGQADGWGTFDYFNWTPVQEWESWIKPWAQSGVKPIGSWEHGLPYPASFGNHGIPDGDGESWITEYTAVELGPAAYRNEIAEYRKSIREAYERNKPGYGDRESYDIGEYDNVQAIWAAHNKRIYRSWRTYGVPMGIEPFGPASSYVKANYLLRGKAKTFGVSNEPLKTPGYKPDEWMNDWNWLSESSPQLEPFNASSLAPFGDALRDNNSALLAYIAGAAPDFATKDHVYRAGETISKQIAVVWDGFEVRKLALDISATVESKQVFAKRIPLSLSAGEIAMMPFDFAAPNTDRRETGNISLKVTDAVTRDVVCRDGFAFSVYPKESQSNLPRHLRVGVVDPSGDSVAMLVRLGVAPIEVNPNKPFPTGLDLLVIGRRALESIEGTGLMASLPRGIPVLVLEQTDPALARIGFHSYPARTRQVWTLAKVAGCLTGIPNDDLRDWRVSPTLLPQGTDALRLGYNCHAGYTGTVASVVIETPTSGNFTPLLQAEFDLAMTPLLETDWQGHRIVFCQLSLVDGVGKDPVATRIASELIGRRLPPAPALRNLAVVGDESIVSLAKTIGERSARPVSPINLQPHQIALAGELDDASAGNLKAWVRSGGTAVILPQAIHAYAEITPGITATAVTSSLLPPTDLASSPLLAGLGINDFHARQDIAWTDFNGKGPVADVADGAGRWILLGFDPRNLDMKSQPYLRLTYRRECRTLAQILTNLGANLSAPVESLASAINLPPQVIDLEASGKACVSFKAADDTMWAPLDFKNANLGHGEAWVRISLTITPGFACHDLTLDAGTFDDYDQTYLNGTLLGSVEPSNSKPDEAWQKHRIYPIPDGLLKPGPNVVLIHTWNRNKAIGWNAIVRGPIRIQPSNAGASLYAGEYKHSDDPYLQHHW